MCGRFTLTTSREVLARAFELDDAPALAPRFNVAPGQDVATVWQTPEGRRELRLRRWGLVPHWARDAKIGSRLINARAETAAEKPAFRAALRQRRCLVAADGFYEWAAAGGAGGARQPYYLALPEREPFAIAGLFEHWRGEEGALLESCVLLTVAPNDRVRAVHDRMPAILHREDYARWLDPTERDAQRVQALLAPWAGAALELRAVSRLVNRAGHDDPACIEPLPG
ncbi:MAG: SOS response-associated peptidase [Myxococcales bacterium]|nr:MAG: SOS response-associated peptidase [Myxococcales bacterium]